MAVDFAIGLAGLILLVAPGWLVARTLSLPQPWLAGFIASALTLFTLVLGLDALGVSLSRGAVFGAWLPVTAGAAWCWLHRRPGSATAPLERARFAWREDGLLLLPLIPALAVVVYRATAQPLFGVDTVFRWNYLAEQIFVRGTLGFYPPATAAAYEIYAWPDGIAPLVSTLYFWLYRLAGDTRMGLTAPLVIGQFVLIVAATYALGRRLFSARAGAFAAVALAASPLALWATAMGQETGLTAISLAALLLYLPRSRSEESSAPIVAAALAAGCGALAREYGLVAPVLGIALCLTRSLSPRATGLFVAVALVVTVPWYGRNGSMTGNPLFNLAVGGAFPVNEVHAWLNESYHVEFGWANLPPEAGRLILANGLAPILATLAGTVVHFQAGRSLLAAIAVFVAVWAASVAYTAAGFMYSLRVLNPALVPAAVLGGAVLARWIPARRHLVGVVFGLTLVATDASLRALTLPANVYRLPSSSWLGYGRGLHEYHARPIYAEIGRVAGSGRILVLGPHALLTKHGARALPLWSPEVRFLYDSALTPKMIAGRLQAANIGFVLLNTGAVNERFLARSAFFRDPEGRLQPIWSDSDMVLLRVVRAP